MNLVNITFLALEYFISVAVVLGMIKLFGKLGTYVALATLIIASNIGVMKLYQIFGIDVTAANMSMGLTFAIYSIVTEVYGKKEGQKAVWIGFLAQLVFVVLGLVYVGYIPSSSDTAHEYLSKLFAITPRVAFASWLAFIVSGYVAVWTHNALRNRTKLWLRNNVATKIGQIVDNLIFCVLVFVGILEFKVILFVVLTTTFVEFLLDYADTWAVYVGVKLLRAENCQNEGGKECDPSFGKK